MMVVHIEMGGNHYNFKKIRRKICRIDFLSYLCNPKLKSGGGEMVDTLL